MSVWVSASRTRCAIATSCLRNTARRRLTTSVCRRDVTKPEASYIRPVTKIEKLILDGIKATGPISYSTYMNLCLSHPTDGYYMNSANKIFGSAGDFVTSPEISQIFGELIAIWFLLRTLPDDSRPVRIIELGPGRGTLMDDIIRVVKRFKKNLLRSIHLVETSPALLAVQQSKLSSHGVDIQWYDNIEDVPQSTDEITFLVAHEFFDALPFHVLQKSADGWREVMIASNVEGKPSTSDQQLETSTTPSTSPRISSSSISDTYPRLRRVLASEPTPTATVLGHSSPRFKDLPEGSYLEVSPASHRIAKKIAELLSGKVATGNGATPAPSANVPGGYGLIIDYGADHAFSDSFRAFKSHKQRDPFETPGKCDLTVNVDFAFLKEAMAGFGDSVVTHGPIFQADFLRRMGYGDRATELINRSGGSREGQEAILSAAQRLMDRTGMGTQYQFLGIAAGPDAAATKDQMWPFVEVVEEND